MLPQPVICVTEETAQAIAGVLNRLSLWKRNGGAHENPNLANTILVSEVRHLALDF